MCFGDPLPRLQSWRRGDCICTCSNAPADEAKLETALEDCMDMELGLHMEHAQHSEDTELIGRSRNYS